MTNDLEVNLFVRQVVSNVFSIKLKDNSSELSINRSLTIIVFMINL